MLDNAEKELHVSSDTFLSKMSSTWTSGAKNGLGTAIFNPESGRHSSNVWFTLSHGMLTEVYYPDMSHAQLQHLQFMVTDGATFIDFEASDMNHDTRLLSEDALVYRQVNTSKRGKYQISKTWITNPDEDVVLVEVTFQALVGKIEDYQLWFCARPLVNGNGEDDAAAVCTMDEKEFLLAWDAQTVLALGSSVPFAHVSVEALDPSKNLNNRPPRSELSIGRKEVREGHVVLMGRLHLTDGTSTCSQFTLALGFASNAKRAMNAVSNSLAHPFEQMKDNYASGWQAYVKCLRPPGTADTLAYYSAAMTIRAHEDKLHPGAIVASLSIPWGDSIPASSAVGGYHLVWSRDLCQIASALAVIGDWSTARRALAYLDEVQQKSDGSFPQNTWPDGSIYWDGLQLDEVAYPILLAYQLGATDRYESLVKPAAHFILAQGPVTQQERWEENRGYSPSTIAAEIAALVVAAEMGRLAGDFSSAAMYLKTADEWARHVEEWTVAKNGQLAEHPYFIRISETTNPDDGLWIELKNGGGWHDKTTIVDAGFLDLVRLGIRPADDPIIVGSINVIDQELKYEAEYGPLWCRYNYDGYGEYADGSPYNGSGRGRPWPILSGERGEYEIAWQQSLRRQQPNHMFGPQKLLETLAGSANDGGMIPEQIWDQIDIPERYLQRNRGTGCATPLVWAMAQYLRLEVCIQEGRIVEAPDVVGERYLQKRWTAKNLPLRIHASDVKQGVSGGSILIFGETESEATVVACHCNKQFVTTADKEGQFMLDITVKMPGAHRIEIIAFDNHHSVATGVIQQTYQPSVTMYWSNSAYHLAHQVQYPTHPVFKPGDFQLKGIRMDIDGTHVYFSIELGNLDNPWGGPSGISKQIIDIYMDTDGKPGSGQIWTKDLHAKFQAEYGWEKLIRVTGNWHHDAGIYNSDWSFCSDIDIWADHAVNTVRIAAPLCKLGGIPQTGWGLMILLAGEEYGYIRPVCTCPGEWTFGRGKECPISPQFVDIFIPDKLSGQLICESVVQLPMLRLG